MPIATINFTVTCDPPAPPVANDDSATVSAPGYAIVSVLANDTYVGTPTLTATTPVPPQLSFTPASGAVQLLPGAAPGVYTFDYQLTTPGGSDTATVTVTYAPAAQVTVARDDSAAILLVPGVAISSVLANDTYSGTPTLTGSPPPELAFNTSTGQVSVLPDTPPGTYSFTYQLCTDNGCDMAIVSVTVQRSALSPECYDPLAAVFEPCAPNDDEGQ